VDLLAHVGPRGDVEGLELHGLAALGALADGGEHAHVGEALEAGGLGVDVVEDAAREVDELGRELIAFAALEVLGLAVDGREQLEALRVLVRGIEAQLAGGPEESRSSETSAAP
jgi:hypothetical protein